MTILEEFRGAYPSSYEEYRIRNLNQDISLCDASFCIYCSLSELDICLKESFSENILRNLMPVLTKNFADEVPI